MPYVCFVDKYICDMIPVKLRFYSLGLRLFGFHASKYFQIICFSNLLTMSIPEWWILFQKRVAWSLSNILQQSSLSYSLKNCLLWHFNNSLYSTSYSNGCYPTNMNNTLYSKPFNSGCFPTPFSNHIHCNHLYIMFP